MDLSIVIATTDARWSIEQCLGRLEAACEGLSTELVVVDASEDGTADCVVASGRRVTLLRCRPGTLTPLLWSHGYRRAAGRIVAFTTGHCLASPGWATALVEAIESGAAGAGGPLTVAPRATLLDRAIYYLRYSAFTPATLGAGIIAGEIAGDNAAYDRVWLDAHSGTFEGGFWELDFHRLVRAGGGQLVAVPEAVMAFGRSFPVGTIVRHRFAHGTHFGAERVKRGRAGWQIVGAAPLVPLVMAARAGARIIHTAGDAMRFVVALPWFLVLSSAWAAGEACGAVFGVRLNRGEPVSEQDVCDPGGGDALGRAR